MGCVNEEQAGTAEWLQSRQFLPLFIFIVCLILLVFQKPSLERNLFLISMRCLAHNKFVVNYLASERLSLFPSPLMCVNMDIYLNLSLGVNLSYASKKHYILFLWTPSFCTTCAYITLRRTIVCVIAVAFY